MFNQKVTHFILGAIFFLVSFIFFRTAASALAKDALSEVPSSSSPSAMLASASVQILMVRETSQPIRTEVKDDVLPSAEWTHITSNVSQGIGTLIELNGRVYLITHNHWSLLEGKNGPDFVRFYDAIGNFLLEIPGAAFQLYIVYSDPGTIILNAPQDLLQGKQEFANISDISGLAIGDQVTIGRHHPDLAKRIDFVQASVESIQFENGVPMIRMRTVLGGAIEPGDSGGGIWKDGQLIGNMWMTVRLEARGTGLIKSYGLKATAESIAAGLTADILAGLSTVNIATNDSVVVGLTP